MTANTTLAKVAVAAFDYSALDPETERALRSQTARIRDSVKNTTTAIIEIGRGSLVSDRELARLLGERRKAETTRQENEAASKDQRESKGAAAARQPEEESAARAHAEIIIQNFGPECAKFLVGIDSGIIDRVVHHLREFTCSAVTRVTIADQAEQPVALAANSFFK
jgi:hypothetical protein